MSVISYIDSTGKPVTIPNADGDPLTPSSVYLDGRNVVVGRAAKQAEAHHPDKVASFVKRSMGQAVFERMVDGRHFRPETLSALILKKLKQDAERRIGPIDKAVITVPAFFDDARRRATRAAGEIAGLEVLDIINEPTAAALAYCLESRLSGEPLTSEALDFSEGDITALVYDLGGGTFDVTVVRLSHKVFHTLATDGEVQLGGKDWDDAILSFMADEFEQQHGINPTRDAETGAVWRQAASQQAETAKKMLSQLPSVPVECYYQDKVLRTTLSREQFEEMGMELISRTEIVTDLVVQDQAKLSWDQINQVLLVGGSTRIPAVREMLRRLSGQEPDDQLDPDQVVARGAAIFAAMCDQQGRHEQLESNDLNPLSNVEVKDVNAHSLGVAAYDRRRGKQVSSILIPKNTHLPFAMSRVFRLNKEGATSVRVPVLEGEAPEADANILLGKCVVSGLSSDLPKGSPIQVRLSYDTNGMVNVMALDMTSGQLAQAVVEAEAALGPQDIARERDFINGLTIL